MYSPTFPSSILQEAISKIHKRARESPEHENHRRKLQKKSKKEDGKGCQKAIGVLKYELTN